jgi:hypothetical protein
MTIKVAPHSTARARAAERPPGGTGAPVPVTRHLLTKRRQEEP